MSGFFAFLIRGLSKVCFAKDKILIKKRPPSPDPVTIPVPTDWLRSHLDKHQPPHPFHKSNRTQFPQQAKGHSIGSIHVYLWLRGPTKMPLLCVNTWMLGLILLQTIVILIFHFGLLTPTCTCTCSYVGGPSGLYFWHSWTLIVLGHLYLNLYDNQNFVVLISSSSIWSRRNSKFLFRTIRSGFMGKTVAPSWFLANYIKTYMTGYNFCHSKVAQSRQFPIDFSLPNIPMVHYTILYTKWTYT